MGLSARRRGVGGTGIEHGDYGTRLLGNYTCVIYRVFAILLCMPVVA